MMKLSVAVLVLFVGVCTADTTYKVNTNMAHVEFKIKSLMASKQSNISKDKNKLTVKFEDLQQVKADNATIAGLNNNFSGAKFMFGDATDVTGTPSSRRLEGTANVFGGMFNLVINVFTSNANLTIGSETTTVMTGDVRMAVETKDMTFHDDADKLKLTLNIKGSEAPAKTTTAGTDGVAYTLGGGGVVKLSKKVKKGTVTAVAPIIHSAGSGSVLQSVTPMMSGNTFSLSLPKGSNLYTLYLQLASAENDDGDGSDGNAPDGDVPDGGGTDAAATAAPLLITWVVAIVCKVLL